MYFKYLFTISSYSKNIQIIVQRHISHIIDNRSDYILEFYMPLLRSLLMHHKETFFFSSFIESGIVDSIYNYVKKDGKNLSYDLFMQFVQVFCTIDPKSVFSTYTLLPLFVDNFRIDKYFKLLIPCIQAGLKSGTWETSKNSAKVIITIS